MFLDNLSPVFFYTDWSFSFIFEEESGAPFPHPPEDSKKENKKRKDHGPHPPEDFIKKLENVRIKKKGKKKEKKDHGCAKGTFYVLLILLCIRYELYTCAEGDVEPAS